MLRLRLLPKNRSGTYSSLNGYRSSAHVFAFGIIHINGVCPRFEVVDSGGDVKIAHAITGFARCVLIQVEYIAILNNLHRNLKTAVVKSIYVPHNNIIPRDGNDYTIRLRIGGSVMATALQGAEYRCPYWDGFHIFPFYLR
jgi:hypothetical protein